MKKNLKVALAGAIILSVAIIGSISLVILYCFDKVGNLLDRLLNWVDNK